MKTGKRKTFGLDSEKAQRILVENDVETVCLLYKLSEAKNHISVKVDMDDIVRRAALKAGVDWMEGFEATELVLRHGRVTRKKGLQVYWLKD